MCDRPLLDTGLTAGALAARHRQATIEEASFSAASYRQVATMRQLVDQLDQATAGPLLCYLGDWQEGLRILCELAPSKYSIFDRDNMHINGIETLHRVDPGRVQEVLNSFLGPGGKTSLRLPVTAWIIDYGQADTGAVPGLVGLLGDDTPLHDISRSPSGSSSYRRVGTMGDAAAVALITIGASRPEPVVSALAGSLLDRGGSPSGRAAAARALAGLDLTLATRTAMALRESRGGPVSPSPSVESLDVFIFSLYTRARDVSYHELLYFISQRIRDSGASAAPGVAAPIERHPPALWGRRARALREAALRRGGGGRPVPPVGVADVPGGEGQRAVDALIRACDAEDAGLRLAAVQALSAMGEFGGRAPVGRLLTSLGDRDDRVRIESARALKLVAPAALGPEIDRLIPLLGDRDPGVRAAAVDLLGWIDVPAGRPIPDRLIGLLGDPYADVRASAARALGWSGTASGPVVARLIRMLGDETWLSASYDAWYLPGIGGYPVKTSEHTVGEAAAMVVEEIARRHPERVIPALTEVLGESATNSLARDGIVRILGGISSSLDEASVSKLTPFLDRRQARIRAAAIRALGHSAESQAGRVADLLMASLGDSDHELRMASIESLGDILVTLNAAGAERIARSVTIHEVWGATLGVLSPPTGLVAQPIAAWSSQDRAREECLKRIEERLVSLLPDGNPAVRAAAAQVISRTGMAGARAMAGLVGLLGDDTAVTGRVFTGHVFTGPVLTGDEFARERFDLRSAPEPLLILPWRRGEDGKRTVSDVSVGALERIGSMHSGGVITALADLVADRRAGTTARVAATLVLLGLERSRRGVIEEVGGHEVLKALDVALGDGDYRLRLTAVAALTRIDRSGSDRVGRRLVALLGDRSPPVRSAAIEALTRFGAPPNSAVPGLARLLADEAQIPEHSGYGQRPRRGRRRP
jgi:HEAT repeat protein